jgi:pathogenesis-related protein 1
MKSALLALALFLLAALGLAQMPAQKTGTPISQPMLAAHNAARAKVGTPSLIWSDALAKVAQQWADTLISNGRFEHRPNPQYGENLYELRGGNSSPAQVVSDWLGEQKDYDAAANKCKAGAVCGHFTQVVSKSSKQVGCAKAGDSRREVWVCNYDPPGNWVGERPF